MTDIIPSTAFPVMPLRNTVLFPQQVIPLYIGRERSLKLLRELPSGKKTIVVVAQREGSVENPEAGDLFDVGTTASVMKILDMPDGSQSAIVQGGERVRIKGYSQTDPYFKASIEGIEEIYDADLETDAMSANIRTLFRELSKVADYITQEHISLLSNIQHPARLVDRAVSMMQLSNSEKQDILEETDVTERLKKATVLINREIQRQEIGEKIQTEVQEEISKSQREYFLREQMKAIKKELGEDDQTLEIKELEEKILEAGMPEEALKVANKEIDRLQRIPPSSPEYTVSRTYLDWLVELPWSNETEDRVDIQEALNILDRDHYGLKRVKNRVLEFLAVRKLKMEQSPDAPIKGPILCFQGPPGTGKTSLGKSIADALGREFIRISLGGVRDEAEIRGHRRTYIGALPGRIIQGLKKAKTRNPVFMLDEVDKLGTDFRGDPSSALLEVLDPEQNHSFSDHYLEVTFDLSKVMFIATANWLDPIPGPLRDRMEMIDFPGYIEEEKIHIAKSYLIPKQVTEHALEEEQITFMDTAIGEIIGRYTYEAGVRNLERQIANVCRKVARERAEGNDKPRRITKSSITKLLGPPRRHSEIAERMSNYGIVIGLAYTAVGGDILFIEAMKMEGKGGLKLTGKLGDVMKESAQAVYSYIRSNAELFDIDPDFYKKWDIHVHIPAGAVPKDGPSAGITLFTAMISLLTERLVKSNLGMTGEITLRGAVLPIGGIREKVMAANRAGLTTVILPKKNEADLVDLPEKVKKEMDFKFVEQIRDVIELALEPADGKSAKKDKVKKAS
ncbi:MAG: endopeptidase La [Candidatus Marinimicrobia bacterium]|jgi:ATP-dependent Lon protease|nr:endopeptidase La [Candidatus Neomarinimicrobiota bacterium]MBT4034676.1 endopeptidase La [Candidatus Neomarinimicrobiota bacterium]MBT4361408.1 endopeptidase La [Candidatus Neomarinimicrobiota bacterium]MBT4713871.1 endopeptidase La [Candidatus Neomarinimicrobiota bacterium]MBT4994516.1 endopeptidase La [Candidatus Neomarinimicrobiota bacterium]